MRTSRPSGFALPRRSAREPQRQPVHEDRGRPEQPPGQRRLGLAGLLDGLVLAAGLRAHRDVVLDRVVGPDAAPADLGGGVLARLVAVGDAVEVGAEAVALARDLEPQVPDVALVAREREVGQVEVGAEAPGGHVRGRHDLHRVAAAAGEQEGGLLRLGRDGALDVQRRVLDVQAGDLGVRRQRLGLDGQRAALRARDGEAIDALRGAEHDGLVDLRSTGGGIELLRGRSASLGHQRGEIDLPVADDEPPPLDDLDAAGHATRVLGHRVLPRLPGPHPRAARAPHLSRDRRPQRRQPRARPLAVDRHRPRLQPQGRAAAAGQAVPGHERRLLRARRAADDVRGPPRRLLVHRRHAPVRVRAARLRQRRAPRRLDGRDRVRRHPPARHPGGQSRPHHAPVDGRRLQGARGARGAPARPDRRAREHRADRSRPGARARSGQHRAGRPARRDHRADRPARPAAGAGGGARAPRRGHARHGAHRLVLGRPARPARARREPRRGPAGPTRRGRPGPRRLR